jgi:CBS domain-containing protein
MPSITTPQLRSILARDAMHAPILATDPAATVQDVASIMGANRVHCVVVDGVSRDRAGEHLVWGIVSDLDLIKAAMTGDAELTAGQIAAGEAVVVDATDDLETVCSTLIAHDCSHVVVTSEGRPVGVISTLDIASVLGD